MSQIILASASPRRREHRQIGLNFEVCPAKGEEIIIKEPKEVVMELCLHLEGERSRVHVKNIWR